MTKGRFIVVIGASAGSATALPKLLSQLTPDMNIAVFIVVHVTKRAIGQMLTDRLQKHTTFTCKMPRNNEQIKSHYIYVARPDHHMMIKDNKILIGKGPMENRYRPSIDALFRSAAVHHNTKTIGIILSGLLEDGAAGMSAIKRSGGSCIVQLPEDAPYPDMPLAVMRNLKPDYAERVDDMANALTAIMRKTKKAAKVPQELVKEAEIAENVNVGIEYVGELGKHSVYSCPDCGGGLWELGTRQGKSYRCHVGHAFTEEGLLGAMENSTETALWTALRIIEERKNLLMNLADKEKKDGNKNVATRYTKRIAELQRQIDQLRQVLFRTLND
jgi:two-component system, chemotaxis family, protein-glutamate methylesterase/glutaminase